MKKLLSVLAFSVLILTCQAKELSLNLEAGQVYQQELNNQMDIQLRIEGNDMLIHGNFDIVVEYLVKPADSDDYEMQMSLKNVRANISGDQFNLSLDTAASENNPFNAILKLVVNKPIVYTMSKTGKILDIPDLSGLNLDLNLSGDTTLTKLLEESMNSNSGGLMPSVYPDKEVNVGDSWTVSSKMPNSENKMVNTYTWKSSKRGKNIIEMNTDDFDLDFKVPIKSEQEITLRVQMKGNSGGEFQLDKKTGWVEASESHFDAECKVTLAPNAQMPDGAEFPLSIHIISKASELK